MRKEFVANKNIELTFKIPVAEEICPLQLISRKIAQIVLLLIQFAAHPLSV